MKKNFNNIFIILILILILILVLVFSSEVIVSILYALDIWKNSIFPSLFPIFIITDLLISYGFIELAGKLTNKITSKLFSLPGETSFVIIASMLSGFPSSAKYIKELLNNNIINYKQAQYLLSFTHFPNPLFVIGVIGEKLLKNKLIGISILFSIIIGNILIALLTKDKNIIIKKINNINISKTKNDKFITILTNSILKTINTLILLLGIITTFLVISTITNNLFNSTSIFTIILSGLLEMTQGINYISLEKINILLKAIIITCFICFGGISIHLQIMSIISCEKIKYSKYLLSRILHCIISSSIVFIILNFILKIEII